MFRKTIFTSCAILLILFVGLGSTGPFPVSGVQAAADPSSAAPAALAGQPASFSGGFGHTCVRYDDGAVKCWGSNRYGQLGNSVLTLHPFPTSVSGLGGAVTALSLGAYHTCALLANQTVQCWGLNSSGQLGNGNTSNSAIPVTVPGLSGVLQIASGYSYTCALVSGGTVRCWGDNTYGQSGGAPSGAPVTSPTAVGGVSGVVALTASLDHTCVLQSGQTSITCWGRNTYGQLGNGVTAPTSGPVTVAMPALGGATITNISAGAQHTCALLSNGRVYCWGEGALGQIGNGSNLTVNATPVLLSTLPAAMAIAAGGYADSGHTCALTTTGGVACWGSNSKGQLGDGSTTPRNGPVNVAGLSSGVQAILVGVNHSCALLSDRTVRCWGSDGSGQLGDGVVSISTRPVDAGGFTGGVSLLGTGDRHTCALVGGQVMCWGDNRNGELGDGSLVNRSAPVAVSGLSGAVTAIDGGMSTTCVIVNSAVKCWGNLDPNTNTISGPTTIGSLASGTTSLSVTNFFGCAVTGGAARCWGDNTYGQLGNGTTTSSFLNSVPVQGLTGGVLQVATGQWFACAIKSDRTVWCWGRNTAGEIGANPASMASSPAPLQVAGLSSIASITAGQDHACAISLAGGVVCWGNNGQGQLGNGGQNDTFSPAPVTGLAAGVSAITAGGYHTCALVSGGVKCWGFNSFGQLGNGLTSLSKVPVAVSGLNSGVSAVIAGGINYDQEQSCAITTNGRLKCWGGNEYGQLGDNLPIHRNKPVRVLGLTAGPELGVNYTTGKPGSYFRAAVANFPAGSVLPIKINGKFVGSVAANAEGYAIFHIKVNKNLVMSLPVSVSTLSTHLNITSSSSSTSIVNPQEGSGQVVYDNASLYYLPRVSR